MPASTCRAAVDAGQGLAQVPVAEPAGGGGGVRVHVVLQHQPLGLGHRRLGLVQVGAGRQRQQPGDPPEHGVGLFRAAGGRRSRGQAAGRRIDPEAPAGRLEAGAVRGLVADAQHLVDELVGDLVLQHLAHHAPGLLQHQPPGQRQRAPLAVPLAQPGLGVQQRQHRPPQPAAEVVLVDLLPGAAQRPQQRGFQGGRQGGGRCLQPPDGRSAVAPAGCSASPSGEATR